jgi:uncharacterized protein YbcI
MTEPDQRTLVDPHAQIAAEIQRVHMESYGTGVGKVTVHLLEDSVFVLLDDLELTNLEQLLLEGGRVETVRHMRALFQETIETTFVAIIERATGRRVTSFLSNTSVEALYSVEVFRTVG